MKVDVCMWAKNGEKFLPTVLPRIEREIGNDINQRIFVDDNSTDNSCKIASQFEWDIYHNQEGWINGGCKEALKHVETKHFVSVEQDVILCKGWWKRIQELISFKDVVVAQGIYLSTNPITRAWENYNVNRGLEFHGIGNNIYNTSFVREIGFVDYPLAMTPFYNRVKQSAYRWLIDSNLVSDHLRFSVFDDLSHSIRFYSQTKLETSLDERSLPITLGRILFSFKQLRTKNAFVFLYDLLLRCSYVPARLNRFKSRK